MIETAKYRSRKKVQVESIDRYLFGTLAGGRMSYRNSLRDLKKIAGRLGFGWASWHTFRRTFATQYIQRGGLLVNLQEILGHADVATTLLYLGSSIEHIVKDHYKYSALAG